MTLRDVLLCADDYGQSTAIDEGILGLLEAGRLSAVSAFSQSPRWPGAGRALIPYRGVADLGLHFNLTHPFAPGTRPLPYWLARSHLPGLSREKLRDLFLHQIDAFAEGLGELPDFIDGHQHVHAFPGVREALTEAVALRWRGRAPPYVRAPDLLAEAGDAKLKARVVKRACRGMEQHLQAGGLACPRWFAGVYSLRQTADFPGLMRSWLEACPEGGLIMCHPALADRRDPIGAAREREHAYLASEDFAALCSRAGVRLARFS